MQIICIFRWTFTKKQAETHPHATLNEKIYLFLPEILFYTRFCDIIIFIMV